MPWFAWYSEKQFQLYGSALYINKKGDVVEVTEINQNPEFKSSYSDVVKLGRVTHFIGVKKRNHNKRRGREPDKMMPSEMIYERGSLLSPSKILN